MTLPPKSRSRLMILVGACVALVLGVLILKASRSSREAARIAAMRQAAMEVYARGDYAAAMPKLSEYLAAKEQSPDQLDALFAFADCRRRFPIPHAAPTAHLAEAVQRLDDYLQVRGTDEKALRLQLRIQNDLFLRQHANNQNEVVNRARKLLEVKQDDVEALTALATALVRRPKPNVPEAQRVIGQLLAASPGNLRGLLLTPELKLRAGTPAAEVLKQVDVTLSAHQKEPAYQGVAAWAYLWAAVRDQAHRDDWWRQGESLVVAASGQPAADVEMAEFISGLLDEVERFKESTDYLRAAADKLASPELERMVVRRLWQSDRHAEAIERTAKIDPASPGTPADLMAYRALALQSRAAMPDAGEDRTRLQNEADVLATALSRRSLEGDAQSWAILLKADSERLSAAPPTTNPAATPSTNPAERTGPTANDLVKAYRKAWEEDTQNAVAMARLGDALYAANESEPAMQQWTDALRLRYDWAYPFTRRATALLESGAIEQAIWHADRARRRSPDSRAINVLWAQAAFAALQSGLAGSGSATPLLADVDAIQKNYPFDPSTLPIQVTLLARVRGVEAAAKRIEQALASQPPLSIDVLLNLHTVDRSEKLGLADRIDDAISKSDGGPARLAVRKAYDLLAAGKPDEGLKVMLDAQKEARGENDKAWLVMVAQYRDRAGDPQASAAMTALVDAYPRDLFVQSQALRTTAITRDRALWGRAIENIHKLVGENSSRWKMEKATYLLAGSPTPDDLKNAISLLSPLVEQNRASFDLRRLLGRAFLADGQYAKAAEQFQEALRQRQQNVGVTIELTEALRLARKSADAAAQLGTLPVSRLSVDQQMAVAQQYELLGQGARAIELLERLPASSARDGRLGRLYRISGRSADAEAAYRRIIAADDAPATDLFAAADYFAACGDQGTAQQFLSRFKKSNTAPAVIEMLLGRFEEHYGSADAAHGHLVKATETAPKDPMTWRALAGYLLRTGKAAEAGQTCDAGLKAIGSTSPELTALKSLATTVASLKEPRSFAALIELLSSDPTNGAATQTLTVLAEAQTAEAELPAADSDGHRKLTEKTQYLLGVLAVKYPEFWPLQDQLIRQDIRVGRTEEAAIYAERALSTFPANPEPAQLAVEAYQTLGRWNDVERVAVLWRQRSGADTVAADIVLAEVLLTRKQTSLAIGRLEPDIRAHPLVAANGTTQPATNPTTRPAGADIQLLTDLYRTYGRALVEADRAADAEAALRPLLSMGKDGRAAWLAVAPAFTKSEPARRWIEQAVAAAGSSAAGQLDPAEQVAVARAWLDAGCNANDAELLKRSAAILEPMTSAAAATTIAASPVTIEALRLYGLTANYLGDYDKAEWCWRTLRKIGGGVQEAEAANNLSYVLLVRGNEKDRAEALSLAKQAVAASPAETNFTGTLARALSATGDSKGAMDGFHKVLARDPTSIEAKLGLADELSRGSSKQDKAEARRLLGEVAAAIGHGPLQPPEIRKQLEVLRARIETADSR